MEPQTTSDIAEIRTAASVLIERMQFLRQTGITFGGLRDLYEILGYPRVITPEQYRQRYRRGGIAARIVNAFPNATWRGGIELVEDEDPKKKTLFEQTVIDFDKRVKLWAKLKAADILTGQGNYAVLLIGGPGESFSQELPKGSGTPKQILYLTPFPEEDAKISRWDEDTKSPRFGLPVEYQLSRMNANSLVRLNITTPTAPFNPTEFQRPVHWSRIMHFAEGCLDNEVFGLPTLENVWNLLDDLEKVTGGGAEAFWLRANQGLLLNVDPKMGQLGEDEKKNMADQAEEYQHNIRRILRMRGVDAKALGSDVANFSNPADAIITQIAGTKGIPKRILTGSEMGELASSQDRDNWKDQVNGRQTGYADPFMVRRLIDHLIEYNYLPEPKQYEVKWSHIEVMTDTEKSAGAFQWAGTKTDEGPVFLRDEIRDHWYGLQPLPKPVVADDGTHTSPAGQLDLQPKIDTETGIALKPPTPPAPIDPSTGKPVAVDKSGKPIVLPPPEARAAEDAEDAELQRVLERAILANNTHVIDRILGIHRPE